MSVRILIGDVREQLATLPDDSVDCVVTSPPYWGLRDYGVAGQIGLEPTLGEHLAVMVEVFREVRRVLKPTGTLWLNYGDCYATTPNGKSAAAYKAEGLDDRTFRDKPFSTVGPIFDPNYRASTSKQRNRDKGAAAQGGRIVAGGYLKPKDLCMVPNRLAIALQDDGWWVRSEIIWHKPNPMPESIKDRPGNSHEKVWLLSKSARYFYDAEAVAEQLAPNSVLRLSQDVEAQNGSARANGGSRAERPMKAVVRRSKEHDDDARPPTSRPHTGLSKFEAESGRVYPTRNIRNVWTIPTAAFSEAHFATFPPELAERCIKAGCPAGGTVLDPFFGAGTTGLVADRLGRNCIGIELNPEYAEMARRRIHGDAPLFAEVAQ